jgi:hypothetical protein
MLTAFDQKLKRLNPGQITDFFIDPFQMTVELLYDLIKIALDNDCYTFLQQSTLYARKLDPVDDADYSGVAFAVPTYGSGSFLDTTFVNSPVIKDVRNELYTMHDQRSPNNVLSMTHSMTEKEWVIFTHGDVYMPKSWGPRFLKAVAEAERRFGPIGVAGVFGVSGDRRVKRTEAGAVIDQNGTRTLTGQVHLPAVVRILDGCVLATRRINNILPDPELGWHFYDADMCLRAAEKDLKNVAVESWLLHRSAWRNPDSAFGVSEEIFKRKWARALPVEVPCTLVV